jgi:FixJ family two-component response regulator
LLTEEEVRRSWAKLFRGKDLNVETFARAETLLDELRPESPLRHRLDGELTELRTLSKV